MNNYYFGQMFFVISLGESKRILQLFFNPAAAMLNVSGYVAILY